MGIVINIAVAIRIVPGVLAGIVEVVPAGVAGIVPVGIAGIVLGVLGIPIGSTIGIIALPKRGGGVILILNRVKYIILIIYIFKINIIYIYKLIYFE